MAYRPLISTSAAFAVCALLSTSCDPGKGGSDSESATSTTQGATTEPTETTASTETTETETAGTDSAGPMCEMYDSTPGIGPTVTVNVTNPGDTPLYFYPVGCGGTIPLNFETAMGESFETFEDGECFPTRCDAFIGEPDCSLGCNDCAGPSTGVFLPGDAGSRPWSGAWITRLEMTAECAPGNNCQRECDRLDQAPDGSYVVKFTAYQTCEGTCECEPFNPGEPCLMWDGGATLSDPVTFEASFSYSGETDVTITTL